MPRPRIKDYSKIPLRPYGNREIISETVRALEALGEWLEVKEDYSLATIETGESTPIKAVVMDEFTETTLVWAPAGWVEA